MVLNSQTKRKEGQNILGNDFYYKTLPVFLIGLIIWVGAIIGFSGLVGPVIIPLTVGFIIFLLIIYIVLWIVTVILALKRQNILSMVIFFFASLVSGMLNSTLLIWASSIFRLEIVLGLFFIAFLVGFLVTLGLLIMGLLFRDKISIKWIYPLLLFGGILIILEISLILIFGYNPILIITSILVLIWLFGVILWDGSRLPQTVSEGYWMLAVINIFLDMINVIIRIFIILIEIFSESS